MADLPKAQEARQLHKEVLTAELPEVSQGLRAKFLQIAVPSNSAILVHQSRTLRNMVHGAQHYAGFIGAEAAAELVQFAVAKGQAEGAAGRHRMDAAAMLIQFAPGLGIAAVLRFAPQFAQVLSALQRGPGAPAQDVRQQAGEVVGHAVDIGMISRADWPRRSKNAVDLLKVAPALSGSDALGFGQVFKAIQSNGIERERALPLVEALRSSGVRRVSHATLMEAVSLMPGGAIFAMDALRLAASPVYHELKNELTPSRAAQLALHMMAVMDKHGLDEELRLGSKLMPVMHHIVKRFKGSAHCSAAQACSDHGFENHVERVANDAMKALMSTSGHKAAGVHGSPAQSRREAALSSTSSRPQLHSPATVPRPVKRESKGHD